MTLAGAKCLVLGGGGFIGTNLSIALAAAGARVEGFGRRPRYDIAVPRRWHEADFANTARLAAALAGKDIVFHLIGGTLPACSNLDPIADIEASLAPSLKLIELCRAAGVRRIVFASSGGTVYGVTGPDPIAETCRTDPITGYGVVKLAVEKYLTLSQHQYGLDTIILRIANPYGPFQYSARPHGIIARLLAKAIAGETLEIWGDGSIVRDFLHIDDVVRAMMLATHYEGEHRIFNVGSGVGRTVRSVVEAIMRRENVPADRVRFLPGRQGDVPVNILDTRRIRAAMDWRPLVDWDDGLDATARWTRTALGVGS